MTSGGAPGASSSPSGAASTVLDAGDINRALSRMAHEVTERNRGAHDVVVVGVHTRGVPLGRRLAEKLTGIEGTPVPFGVLDVTMYRDDIGTRPPVATHDTDLPLDLSGKVVVLVDDVLFTGRTIRAALDALIDFARPRAVQLAVLVDRGHRELPLRADFVGKNIPTSPDEEVSVRLTETDGVDEVVLLRTPQGPFGAGRSAPEPVPAPLPAKERSA